MKKEILVAIVIGFILGLVITFGIWTANKSLQENNNATKSQETENQPIANGDSQTEEKISLIITSPQNNSLLDQEEIEIIGQTSPLANIVVLFEEGEEIIQADEQGEFTTEISLSAGANEITVTAFDQDGNETSRVLNLVYSTAQI